MEKEFDRTIENKKFMDETITNKKAGKYLTFFLGAIEFGIEIIKVQEIIGVQTITKVPRVPKFIKGVINLRGKILPIMDLRLKLYLEEGNNTEETCIIIVKTNNVEMGIIVDKVFEVINIENKNIGKTPSFGENINTEYISGIGRLGDKVKLLLDIDKVLSIKNYN